MTLTRTISLRVLWITLICLAVSLIFALWRAQFDVGRELRAVHALAPVLQHLVRTQGGVINTTDAEIDGLRQVVAQNSLRHLDLIIGASPASAVEATLARWSVRSPRENVIVEIRANPESEQRETSENIATIVVSFVALAAMIAIGVQQAVKRALLPLANITEGMKRVEEGDLNRRLETMDVAEFERIGSSFNHLVGALQTAERERLSMTLRLRDIEEVERARLARDLHDEFGQQLTAMQANLQWLKRKSTAPDMSEVINDIQACCDSLRQGVARTLRALRPEPANADGLTRGNELALWIEALTDGWAARPGNTIAIHTTVNLDEFAMPYDLALALYRMTQEALTNALRHSQATRVDVRLTRDVDALHWQVQDDGTGMGESAAAMKRGVGLAGLRERAWAFGATITIDSSSTGTLLSASFPLTATAEASHGH